MDAAADTKEQEEEAPEKTREQMQQELVTKYKQALQTGMKVLQDAFVTTVEETPGDSDAEDEADAAPRTQTIFEPKVGPRLRLNHLHALRTLMLTVLYHISLARLALYRMTS